MNKLSIKDIKIPMVVKNNNNFEMHSTRFYNIYNNTDNWRPEVLDSNFVHTLSLCR